MTNKQQVIDALNIFDKELRKICKNVQGDRSLHNVLNKVSEGLNNKLPLKVSVVISSPTSSDSILLHCKGYQHESEAKAAQELSSHVLALHELCDDIIKDHLKNG